MVGQALASFIFALLYIYLKINGKRSTCLLTVRSHKMVKMLYEEGLLVALCISDSTFFALDCLEVVLLNVQLKNNKCSVLHNQ